MSIDSETYLQAIGRVFDIPWDAAAPGWLASNSLAMDFTAEDLTTAENLSELSEHAIADIKRCRSWSTIMTLRLIKLLHWTQESRRTTAQWSKLQKENITTRELPKLIGSSLTAAGNRSFDFSVATSGDIKQKDIKLDLKTMVKLKNDRNFCSYYRAFKNRLRSERLGHFWNDEYVPPTVCDPSFSEYEYQCSKVLMALEYTCKTPQSRLIIRKHMDSFAARACLAELEATYTNIMSRKLDLRNANNKMRAFPSTVSYR